MKRATASRCYKGLLIAALLSVISQFALAQTKPRQFLVQTPDGVTISAQEWGNPSGPEIVFIHGFLQSNLSWQKQVASPALAEFRMITYDIRGHGASEKIMYPPLYGDGVKFADELNAVLDTAQVKRPILVGWSYGSRIVGDYLLKYGTKRIAGINFVGSAVNGDAKYFGPGFKALGLALSEDLLNGVDGTRAFVRECFSKQPTAEEYERILAYNMLVPAKIRNWMRRPAPYEPALKSIDVPVLVTHGENDRITLLSLGQYVAATVPNARASYYPGVGHSTFWEEPERFNSELGQFVREAASRR